MKNFIIICIFSILGVSGIYAQNNDEMKKWMDYMTPGKEHQEMADMTGDWDAVNLLWMDPAGEPTKAVGNIKIEMILGGRYQHMTMESVVMGMPYSGAGFTGFDNAKKVFVSTYIDNMGTGIMYSEGTYDKDAGGIVFKGKEVDPMTGEDMDFKEIYKVIDKNKFIMEMYNVENGKEFKSMEMTCTRK